MPLHSWPRAAPTWAYNTTSAASPRNPSLASSRRGLIDVCVRGAADRNSSTAGSDPFSGVMCASLRRWQLAHVDSEHLRRRRLVVAAGVQHHVDVLFFLTGEILAQRRPVFQLAQPQRELL